MIKNERIDETNIIRGIACLAVVLVHITANPASTLNAGSINSIIFILLNRAAKFTTPTFIFLSGLTLFYSYERRDLIYGKFLKKRFSATLIPYLIWSVVYLLYFYFQGIYTLSPKFIMENILLGKMSYHLYFVVTITQFYVLFGVFLYFYRRYNSNILLGITLVSNLLFLKYGAVSMTYSDRFFMNYIFFFSLGCYVGKNLLKVKNFSFKFRYHIILCYIIATLYECYLFYKVYIVYAVVDVFMVLLSWVIFSTISIFLLIYIGIIVLDKNGKMNSVLKTISKSSYYVYLSHPLILNISDKWLLEKGVYSITGRAILNIFIVYSISLSLSIGYTKLKSNLKNRSNLLNNRSPM